MGIAGLRILQELQSVSCLSLDLLPASRKGICCSRSFGKALTTLSSLEEVLAQYVSQAAKKLRKGNLATPALTVFISTSRFKDNLYSMSHTIELPVASDYTPELIRYSLQALQKIYRKGLAYKKAGIFFQDLIPNQQIQASFFDPINRIKAHALMKTVDDLHRQFGDNSIQFAAQGISKASKTNAQYRSPRYTTEWKEILEIN